MADAKEEQKEISILSYNIRHGLGNDGRIDLDRVAAVIAAEQPDLVAVQEVDRFCERSGRRDLARELGRLLNLSHAFGKFMDYDGGEYGLAALSRHPIETTKSHRLPDGAEPRCALEIVVRPADFVLPLSFVCLHLDWTDGDYRLAQMEALLKAVPGPENPVVLAGDFNEERTDPAMRLLQSSGWKVLDKGGEKTFPSDCPEREIDFVATRGIPSLRETCRVVDERVASDHKPVFASITY